jgi:Tol biopolymer transport system component
MQGRTILRLFSVMAVMFLSITSWAQTDNENDTAKLREEVRGKGWIAYSSRSDNGTWDIFLSRPDGSQRRNITNTPDSEEAAPRFSPVGDKILFRRLLKGTTINHDQYGVQGQLVVAMPDGANPQALGAEGEYPWACWSPDGAQLACLAKKGIQVIDLASKQVVRQFPRQGIYQQLSWSPDGRWFCGTANHGGEYWTVVRMNAENGEVNVLRSFQNCTPDWYPDSTHVILSTRPAGQPGANGYGYTQLWEVDGEGKDQKLLYGEDGLHIYGGALSPDGNYVLFTKCPEDGGGAEKTGGTICLIRMDDTPAIEGPSPDLRKLHPEARKATVIEIDKGWEPHWTPIEMKATP